MQVKKLQEIPFTNMDIIITFLTDKNYNIIQIEKNENARNISFIDENYLGKNILTILDQTKKNSNYSNFVRYLMNKNEDDIRLSYRLYSKIFPNDLITLNIVNLGEKNLFILENLPLNKNQQIFSLWNIISKTFPGGIIYLDQEENIIDISNDAITLLLLKNKSDGILLSKESILNVNLKKILEDNMYFDLIPQIFDKKKFKHQSFYYDDSKTYFRLHEKLINIVTYPIFEENKIIGTCIYLMDFSKIFVQNQKIKEQQEQIVNSSQLASLGEMASSIAHEINNPLTILNFGIANLKNLFLKSNLTSEKSEKIFSNLKSTMNRIENIIKGMKILNRKADDSDYDLLPINLKDCLNETIAIANIKFKKCGVRLINETIDLDSESKIFGSNVHIYQVLLNILHNALDATEENVEVEDKWVKIKYEIENGFIKFLISDTGKGIPERVKQKIFEPFFTTKPIGKGTGIGLSISKKILLVHQGNLNIDENQEYTTFVITLPLLKA